MGKLFVSHNSKDDAFVRGLRESLGNFGIDAWIDSREMRGGDILWTEIQKAIEDASAYAVVVSTDALQSNWVGKELKHAVKVQKKRGKDKFYVIPLSLDGTKLGVLEEFFEDEPLYIQVSSNVGGVEAALHDVLVALGKRLPNELSSVPEPSPEPLEELVLELTDLKFVEDAGIRHPSARARLVYEPATVGQPKVHSMMAWRLIAPIGPIEAGELRWYLEKYAIWPSHYFSNRARKVEENLLKWGKLLHSAAIPLAHCENVMRAWEKTASSLGRRFSVYVDASLEAGAPETDLNAAREAATALLGLPWELLHNGKNYLFQGAKPSRVRRRVPGTEVLGVAVVEPPIRILLVSARPEDDACSYIDHRVSALPLVEAMESLPGLVKIRILNPPTLAALRDELERAFSAGTPYHVVHFNGHGIYDNIVGLGGLCFESPADCEKIDKRRHVAVFTSELGPLLRDFRIPLVFLEACQSAHAEQASESVASELLKIGVGSVVAMSHSVLVETARRFVTVFYQSLAKGKRVGEAMLAGQRQLKDDNFRGRVFGADELRLEDWFVPVLYQEKDDPQLFKATPSKQSQADFKSALTARLGELPKPPETGFIGRSRYLLSLQRMLTRRMDLRVSNQLENLEAFTTRYAVILGQGGEGKTALAAEFARWVVRSQQMRRAVFVSVELHSNLHAVLDIIGRQLVLNYSVAMYEDLEKAVLPIERILVEQPTILIFDNMESILLPFFNESSEALTADARAELDQILKLCARLILKGETRMIFTSREDLPEPFNAALNQLELHQLDLDDAVKLVERVLNTNNGTGDSSDAPREDIEQLVAAVQCHARTLALLAPALSSRGIAATQQSLVELMVEMEKKFPGSREKSVFASVELSLQRMSPVNRDRARVLGVFVGVVNLGVLERMMKWGKADINSLAGELVGVGLGTMNVHNDLTLHPAICPYFLKQFEHQECRTLTAAWLDAMEEFVSFLAQLQHKDAVTEASLTLTQLPNLFSMLERLEHKNDAEATIELATTLHSLVQGLGRPQLVKRIGYVRDAAVKLLAAGWTHSRFQAARTRIEQLANSGQLQEAYNEAVELLKRAQQAGKDAYADADYDLALAHFQMARLLQDLHFPSEALEQFEEACSRFDVVENQRAGEGARRMIAVCTSEQGLCLMHLGRLDEAERIFHENIRDATENGDTRRIVIALSHLSQIYKEKRQYSQALEVVEETRKRYCELNEPEGVAQSWHASGQIYSDAGNPEAAENAYRKSLQLSVQSGSVIAQAHTLSAWGILYGDNPQRFEDSVSILSQAIEKWSEVGDKAHEGMARGNLASVLRKLRRFDEARAEISKKIKSDDAHGHACSPWISWSILSAIENDAGNFAKGTEANRKAIESYLTYRRSGGENPSFVGQCSNAVKYSLNLNHTMCASEHLERLAASPNVPVAFTVYIQALQAIVAGSRDRTLADATELDYSMAVEILFLIESLEKVLSTEQLP